MDRGEIAVEVGFEVVQMHADVRNELTDLDLVADFDNFNSHLAQFCYHLHHYPVNFIVYWFRAKKRSEHADPCAVHTAGCRQVADSNHLQNSSSVSNIASHRSCAVLGEGIGHYALITHQSDGWTNSDEVIRAGGRAYGIDCVGSDPYQ